MDETDLRILRILQNDASLAVADIAREIGLSASPCWKRIKRLQESGVIRRQTAILDADRLGFGLTVFVHIKTGDHSKEWLKMFADTVTAMPEVQEFHRMAGEVDYFMKVIVRDMRSYDLFYKQLVETTGLTEVTSRFTMEAIKETNALPI